MGRGKKKRISDSRLKAFSSFSDSFLSSSLRSGWKPLVGSWTPGSSSLSSSSDGLITVPISKSNAVVSCTLVQGTGYGVSFWVKDSQNYWAAYPYSTGTQNSTCTNNNCSGTENYTVTQSCSCPLTGYYYPSTCSNGTCSGSENYTAYRSCSCYNTTIYPSNCSSGACSGTESFTNYRSCSCSSTPVYGYCSYTSPTTTTSSLGCVSGFSGCSNWQYPYGETPAPGVCGCPTGQNRVCCTYTSTTGGGWSYSGCSYTGQIVPTGGTQNTSTCNNGSCSGTEAFTDYRSCSCPAQVIQVSTCNNGSCSGIESFTASRSCSCPQTPIYTSTCGNGACSGTYSYQATRNCSCTTSYQRKMVVVKYNNGTASTVGEFSISSTPTTLTITTSGTSVSVTAGATSQNYTNSDGTMYKNFGIIKTNGGTELSTAISSFTAVAS